MNPADQVCVISNFYPYMSAGISVIYIVTPSAIFSELHLNQTFGSPRSSIAEYKKDNENLNREKKLLETIKVKKLEKEKEEVLNELEQIQSILNPIMQAITNRS